MAPTLTSATLTSAESASNPNSGDHTRFPQPPEAEQANHQHASNVLRSMHEMQQQCEMCDMQVVAEGEPIQVHSLVLASCSAYFRSLLCTSKSGDWQSLDMPRISKENLRLLVTYAYTGLLEVTSQNVKEILHTCLLYGFTGAAQICEQFVQGEYKDKMENRTDENRTRDLQGRNNGSSRVNHEKDDGSQNKNQERNLVSIEKVSPSKNNDQGCDIVNHSQGEDHGSDRVNQDRMGHPQEKSQCCERVNQKRGTTSNPQAVGNVIQSHRNSNQENPHNCASMSRSQHHAGPLASSADRETVILQVHPGGSSRNYDQLPDPVNLSMTRPYYHVQFNVQPQKDAFSYDMHHGALDLTNSSLRKRSHVDVPTHTSPSKKPKHTSVQSRISSDIFGQSSVSLFNADSSMRGARASVQSRTRSDIPKGARKQGGVVEKAESSRKQQVKKSKKEPPLSSKQEAVKTTSREFPVHSSEPVSNNSSLVTKDPLSTSHNYTTLIQRGTVYSSVNTRKKEQLSSSSCRNLSEKNVYTFDEDDIVVAPSSYKNRLKPVHAKESNSHEQSSTSGTNVTVEKNGGHLDKQNSCNSVAMVTESVVRPPVVLPNPSHGQTLKKQKRGKVSQVTGKSTAAERKAREKVKVGRKPFLRSQRGELLKMSLNKSEGSVQDEGNLDNIGLSQSEQIAECDLTSDQRESEISAEFLKAMNLKRRPIKAISKDSQNVPKSHEQAGTTTVSGSNSECAIPVQGQEVRVITSEKDKTSGSASFVDLCSKTERDVLVLCPNVTPLNNESKSQESKSDDSSSTCLLRNDSDLTESERLQVHPPGGSTNGIPESRDIMTGNEQQIEASLLSSSEKRLRSDTATKELQNQRYTRSQRHKGDLLISISEGSGDKPSKNRSMSSHLTTLSQTQEDIRNNEHDFAQVNESERRVRSQTPDKVQIPLTENAAQAEICEEKSISKTQESNQNKTDESMENPSHVHDDNVPENKDLHKLSQQMEELESVTHKPSNNSPDHTENSVRQRTVHSEAHSDIPQQEKHAEALASTLNDASPENPEKAVTERSGQSNKSCDTSCREERPNVTTCKPNKELPNVPYSTVVSHQSTEPVTTNVDQIDPNISHRESHSSSLSKHDNVLSCGKDTGETQNNSSQHNAKETRHQRSAPDKANSSKVAIAPVCKSGRQSQRTSKTDYSPSSSSSLLSLSSSSTSSSPLSSSPLASSPLPSSSPLSSSSLASSASASSSKSCPKQKSKRARSSKTLQRNRPEKRHHRADRNKKIVDEGQAEELENLEKDKSVAKENLCGDKQRSETARHSNSLQNKNLSKETGQNDTTDATTSEKRRKHSSPDETLSELASLEKVLKKKSVVSKTVKKLSTGKHKKDGSSPPTETLQKTKILSTKEKPERKTVNKEHKKSTDKEIPKRKNTNKEQKLSASRTAPPRRDDRKQQKSKSAEVNSEISFEKPENNDKSVDTIRQEDNRKDLDDSVEKMDANGNTISIDCRDSDDSRDDTESVKSDQIRGKKLRGKNVQIGKCVRCKLRFVDEASYRSHAVICKGALHQSYYRVPKTELSDDEGSQSSKLQSTSDYKYMCDMCGHQAHRPNQLDVHKYSKHGIPYDPTKYDVIKCEEKGCNYVTIKNASMREHIYNCHSGKMPFVCEQCGKCFRRKIGLKLHLRTHGIGAQPAACNLCGLEFKQKGNLRAHVQRVHLGEKPHVCSHCTYSSFTRFDLDYHKLKRHNIPLPNSKISRHICEVCDFIARTKFDLEKHRRIHTGERPYECDICNNSYFTANSLKTHFLVVHTTPGDRPFKCTYADCDFGAISKSKLKEHVRSIHTKEKPYICPHCGHKAAIKGNLTKHIQKKHSQG